MPASDSCRCRLVHFLGVCLGGTLAADGQQHFFLTNRRLAGLFTFCGCVSLAILRFKASISVMTDFAITSSRIARQLTEAAMMNLERRIEF
jgi:hypothetical protein